MFTQIIKLFKKKDPSLKSKILIIDDSPVDQKIVSSILLKKEYEVLKAFDGKTGIEMAQQHLPDVIILDYNLPDAKGPEICKAIKTSAVTKDIPVLFLTWMDSPASIIDIFEHEAANYLAKPISASILLKEIAQIIADRKSK